MKKLFLLLLMVPLVLVSCSDDDPSNTDDNKQILTSHFWLIQSLTVNPAFNGSTDGMNDWESTDKDDLYIFKDNGELWLDEGKTKYSNDPQQFKTGNWVLNNSQLKFLYDKGSIDNWTIINISDSNLTIRNTKK